ncbi:hypothetical protein EYR41_004194 [Orbilia oligospora]|uniref:Uncharacterized protein n=1 Tax=Orbilia oligospora TaxID=2813651 RepID=A0A8H2HXH5_ORBOL|nr:hypothetical protein EYR41_004194 [Orbilia oligospora]
MPGSSYPRGGGGGSSSASATTSARTEARISYLSSKVEDPSVKLADDSELPKLGSGRELEDIQSEGEEPQKDVMRQFMEIVKNFIKVLLPHIDPKPGHEGPSGKPESLNDHAGTYDSGIEAEALTGVVEDLHKAIDMNRIAITGADAKAPNYFPCWKNIVVMLLKKYSCTDSPSDLMAAKSALEAILQDGDVGFAVLEEQRALFMCQLEVSFDVVNRCTQNFKESNNADLQLAISASEQFFSTYHSKRIKDPEFSYSFGWKVIHYYLLPIETLYHQTNDIKDLQAAIDIYQSCDQYIPRCQVGAALLSSSRIVTRITAAIHASYLFTIGSELDEAVRFAELSAKLFPLMPSRQLDQREQIHVRKLSWVASCSASFTLFGGGGEYNAIRVLELGREAITGLRLEMRFDLTELKLHHPDMAAQFEKFREILDSPLSISTDSTFADDDQTSSVDENRLQDLRHCTNIELNKLIDQIRLLPNFGNFSLLAEEH